MDRYTEFKELVTEIVGVEQAKPRVSVSPFVLRAVELVGYHQYLPNRKSTMTDTERLQLDKEVAVFIATCMAEVNELKRNQTGPVEISAVTNSSMRQHNSEIVSYLLERLNIFHKKVQIMQKERKKSSRKPYHLLQKKKPIEEQITTTSTSNLEHTSPLTSLQSTVPYNNPLQTSTTSTTTTTTPVATVLKTAQVSKSFAERYESEVAAPSKMKEYQIIASKHKISLLKETKQLHEKFSEDRKQAHQMEATVGSISSMLEEFARIIQQQSENVLDIHHASKTATEHVKDTGNQLLLTIERSQSNRRNMVMLIIGLAVLLLLLDFLTP
eukprot:gene6118-12385_t